MVGLESKKLLLPSFRMQNIHAVCLSGKKHLKYIPDEGSNAFATDLRTIWQGSEWKENFDSPWASAWKIDPQIFEFYESFEGGYEEKSVNKILLW